MDWILPDGSGDELLAWVRERFGWSLPIIFVTARVWRGRCCCDASSGADDYVCKPIRLRRVWRSHRGADPASFMAAEGGVGGQCQAPGRQRRARSAARSVTVDSAPVALTNEFDLAELLLRNLGTAVPTGSRCWRRSGSLGGECRFADSRYPCQPPASASCTSGLPPAGCAGHPSAMGIGWNAPQLRAHAALLLISFGFRNLFPKTCRYSPHRFSSPCLPS